MTTRKLLRQLPDWQTHMPMFSRVFKRPEVDLLAAVDAYEAATGGLDAATVGLGGWEERSYRDAHTGATNTTRLWFDDERTEDWDSEQWVFQILMAATAYAARPKPAPPVKRYRRSSEAIRKAKARAEGRVKPRSKKGQPSLEARIKATEAALATSQAKLADLKADPNWAFVAMASVMRREVSIERFQKALATYKARLKAQQTMGK
jgi:hypothetical protein